jgi:hypothetical protein
MNPPSNWNQLKSRCANSACNTANGGCTIILSGNFVMGSYTGEISFSGKAITLWGQEKVLDAAGGGRFFWGDGAGSFLELHDAILQNGQAANGGAVYVNDANVETHDSTFQSNTATGYYSNSGGGAIYVMRSAVLEIYNSRFINHNGGVGAAIFAGIAYGLSFSFHVPSMTAT